LLSAILFDIALQKVIQSTKIILCGIQISKEQLGVLAYADGIVLIGKYEMEVRQLFVKIENIARVSTTDKPRKNKIYDSGMEK
jgi:hypothetical protein